MLEAIRAMPRWGVQTENPRWVEFLAREVDSHSMDTARVVAVLELHTAEEFLDGKRRPAKHTVWHRSKRCRDWLDAAIEATAPSKLLAAPAGLYSKPQLEIVDDFYAAGGRS